MHMINAIVDRHLNYRIDLLDFVVFFGATVKHRKTKKIFVKCKNSRSSVTRVNIDTERNGLGLETVGTAMVECDCSHFMCL